MLVADILTPTPITVDLDTTLAQVKAIFDSHSFHHLLVVENNELFGVISDRDLLRAVSPFVGSASERPVDLATLKRHAHQIMTRKPITVRPHETVQVAAQRLLDCKGSCLPVVGDDDSVLGIVTWHDLLRACLQAGSA